MDANVGSACLIIPNLPAGAFCGIDLLSFTTSPRFRGIRQLPRGWHVVFTGANNTFSIRHGSWFHVRSDDGVTPEVFVKSWNAEREELVAETDATALMSWRANLGSIWREGLTPYRQSAVDTPREKSRDFIEETADWEKLTDCISEQILARITGLSGGNDHWTLTSASSTKEDADNIPGLSEEESAIHPERALEFLPIDLKRTWRDGAVGRERTIAAQDRSWALQNLITKHCTESFDVIGEFQFVFLMVLTLNNYSCLQQWKRLLGLMLTCQDAISQSPKLFTKLLSTLHLQLRHCQDAEGGLFDLTDEGGSLLRVLLVRFRQGLLPQTFEAKEDVLDELDDLEDYLRAEHGWVMNEQVNRQGMLRLEDGEELWMDMNRVDDEDESGEYLPIVVSLTSDQADALQMQRGADLQGRSTLTLRSKKLDETSSESEDEKTDAEEDIESEELDPRF